MNEAQRHRGPDGCGVYVDGNVGLAHTRLAIIDPVGGVQPFVSPDDRLVLVFNGEIYNFKEIRAELEAEFEFTTSSDTEVLLQGYRKWGMAVLERCRGMFAFALYDRESRQLHLARDRVGIKPLYWSVDRNRMVFASEMTGLLASEDVERDVDPLALSGFLAYQYVPAPMSIYKGVRKLLPGHRLEIDVDTGIAKDITYWTLPLVERFEGDYVLALEGLLDDTMRMCVRSDVPFGAFLSGGVDSSVVTAFMTRHLEAPVETFSIGYEEQRHSELRYAEEASRALRTHHHPRVVPGTLAEDLLDKLAWHLGEPFGDSSVVPTYVVSGLAAEYVKMVLSGDGGDESFGGYETYRGIFRDVMDPLSGLRRSLYSAAAHLPLPRRYDRESVRLMGCPSDVRHDEGMRIFREDAVRRLLPAAREVYRHSFEEPPGASPDELVRSVQHRDLVTYMVDDVLTKVDRMSMACSLEVRVPLLDHRVVEFAFSLPLDAKIRRDPGGATIAKYALKRVGDPFFPEGFLERPKMGFGIPVSEWLAGPLAPLVARELRDPRSHVFEFVSAGETGAVLERFDATRRNAPQVWTLLMLSLWVRNVHEGSRAGA